MTRRPRRRAGWTLPLLTTALAGTALVRPTPLTAQAGRAADRPVERPADRKDPDELFEKALRLHQSGDLIGAIQYYEDGLALAPDQYQARSNLGAVFARLGRYEEALEQYKKVLASQPSLAQVRLNLGLAFYKTGRVAEAADEFRSVLKADPKHRDATLLLADCLSQMGEAQQVIALLEPLESTLAGNRLFDYLFGSALIHQNEVARGQTVIDRLLRDGNSAEAHLLLGAQYLTAGETLKAQPELEKALELNPELPSAHALYAKILQQNREHEGAAREYAAELKRNPNDFDSNLWLGLLRREENRLDEAMAYLQRARRLRPHDLSVAWALGRVHLAANRVEEARAELEKVTAAAPRFQPARVVLANVYYRLGLKELGDEQRTLVQKLKAEAQEEQARAEKEIGATSFRGEDAPRDLPQDAPSQP
jgi:tetratricopeptide (TPR) repeat protein